MNSINISYHHFMYPLINVDNQIMIIKYSWFLLSVKAVLLLNYANNKLYLSKYMKRKYVKKPHNTKTGIIKNSNIFYDIQIWLHPIFGKIKYVSKIFIFSCPTQDNNALSLCFVLKNRMREKQITHFSIISLLL